MNLNHLNPLNYRRGRAAIASVFDPLVFLLIAWSALFLTVSIAAYGVTGSLFWIFFYGVALAFTIGSEFKTTLAEHDRARKAAATPADIATEAILTGMTTAEAREFIGKLNTLLAASDRLQARSEVK